MQNITLITAIAGLVFGLLGAVLGVINTWRAFDRDRVRVKVVPVFVFNERNDQWLGVELTNLSYFPVTITSVGFLKARSDDYMPFLAPELQGCRLPERMEARTRFTAFIPMAACQHPNFATINRGYADTACGRRFTGTSGALRQHVQRCLARQKG